MRVLVLGAYGMLGHRLLLELGDRDDVRGTCRRLSKDGLPAGLVPADMLVPGVDAERFESVVAAISETGPDAVVNCIGIVKQLKEAHDPVRFDTGRMVASNLRAVGIEAEANGIDLSTLVDRLDAMDYQMLIIGWGLGADPVGNVFDVLGPLASTNTYGFWSFENPNPFYEDLLGVGTLADTETQALADQVLELGELARSTLDVAEQKT